MTFFLTPEDSFWLCFIPPFTGDGWLRSMFNENIEQDVIATGGMPFVHPMALKPGQ
ncbi:MAG: hypothetical protein JW801_14700 [Bacteroidales bacterium]|nr:hypothetical protein [Bacteroidales bacterium]